MSLTNTVTPRVPAWEHGIRDDCYGGRKAKDRDIFQLLKVLGILTIRS